MSTGIFQSINSLDIGLAQPTIYEQLTAPAKSPLAESPVYLAVWEGSLRWCGAILGPEGFLAFTFEEDTAEAARTHLLTQLESRIAGWTVTIIPHAPAAIAEEISHARVALEHYGNGLKEDFNLRLDYQLGTPFQQEVWKALKGIPYGKTISYGELAARVNNPDAARAVGNANGKNVMAPIVPCHRVIQSTGELGGYGGGLPLKERLLRMEGSWPQAPVASA